MLPDHLYSTYGRYKADTDHVAHWLATTAQKYGYTLPPRQTEAIPNASRTPRLKGKARKQARASVPAQACNDRPHRIKIAEFIPLAKCIAKCWKLKDARPETFASVLEYCIRERSRHLAHHSGSGMEATPSDDDRRHDHFISILKQVKKILHSVLSASGTSEGSGHVQTSLAVNMSNTFETLSIEEPVKPVELDESPREPLAREPARYVVDIGVNEEEMRIATAMLFVDLHRLRTVVRAAWQRYLSGKLDLMAASITSNTAIDFMRHIQLDFEDAFPGRAELNSEFCYGCAYVADQFSTDGPAPIPCMKSARFVFTQFKKVFLDDTSSFVPTVAPCNLPLYDELDSRPYSSISDQHAFRDLK